MAGGSWRKRLQENLYWQRCRDWWPHKSSYSCRWENPKRHIVIKLKSKQRGWNKFVSRWTRFKLDWIQANNGAVSSAGTRSVLAKRWWRHRRRRGLPVAVCIRRRKLKQPNVLCLYKLNAWAHEEGRASLELLWKSQQSVPSNQLWILLLRQFVRFLWVFSQSLEEQKTEARLNDSACFKYSRKCVES